MGLFDFWIKKENKVLKERILFTQKNRIIKLEKEVDTLKRLTNHKDDEIKVIMSESKKTRETLTEQIIELSNKFADVSQKMLEISHDNTKFKALVESKKKK